MKDKVIIITGASRGLGESLAVILAGKGAHVVVSGRNTAELEKVACTISGTAMTVDVTKEQEVVNLINQTVKKFGRIDILINNAGIWLPRASLEETDMERSHDMLEVNLFGTVYGVRAVLPHMRKQGKGMIVNVVSTSALAGRPMSAMYSASKHAQRGFTDSMREELKGTSISVIGIYPGGIKTHLFDESKPADFAEFMTPEYVAQKIVDNLEKNTPETELILKRPGQI